MIKKNLKNSIKVVFTLILLFIIFKKVGIIEIYNTIITSNIYYLILGLITMLIWLFLVTYKWFLLSKSIDLINSYFTFLKYKLFSIFFNIVIPGGFAGEISRIVQFKNLNQKTIKSTVAASVFTDRILSIQSSLIILFIISPFKLHELEKTQDQIAMISLAFFLLLLSLIPFSRRAVKVLSEKIPFPSFLQKYVKKFLTELIYYRVNPKVILKPLIISIFCNLFLFLITFIIIYSIGMSIDFLSLCFYIPLISIFTKIPISIGGLGLRELSYAFFLTKSGFTSEQAVAVSLLYFFITFCFGLLGGGYFVFERLYEIINTNRKEKFE